MSLVPLLTNSSPTVTLWSALKNNPVFNGSLEVDGVGQAQFAVESDANSSTATLAGNSTDLISFNIEGLDGGGAVQKSINIQLDNLVANQINSTGAALEINSFNNTITIDSRNANGTGGEDITLEAGDANVLLNADTILLTATSEITLDAPLITAVGDIFQAGTFSIAKAVETVDRSAPLNFVNQIADFPIQSFATTTLGNFYRITMEFSCTYDVASLVPPDYFQFVITNGGEGTCIPMTITNGMLIQGTAGNPQAAYSGSFSYIIQDADGSPLTLTGSPANASSWSLEVRNCVIEDLGVLATVPPGSLPLGF